MPIKSFYSSGNDVTARELTITSVLSKIFEALVFLGFLIGATVALLYVSGQVFQQMKVMDFDVPPSAWTIVHWFMLVYICVLVCGFLAGWIPRYLKEKLKETSRSKAFLTRRLAFLANEVREKIEEQLDDKETKWTLITESGHEVEYASLSVYILAFLASFIAFLWIVEVAQVGGYRGVYETNFVLLLAFLALLLTRQCNEATLLSLLTLLGMAYLYHDGLRVLSRSSNFELVNWPFFLGGFLISAAIVYRIYLSWQKSRKQRFLLVGGTKAKLVSPKEKGWQIEDISLPDDYKQRRGASGYSFLLASPDGTTEFNVATIEELEVIGKLGLQRLSKECDTYVKQGHVIPEWKALIVCAIAWLFVAHMVVEMTMMYVLMAKPSTDWVKGEFESGHAASKEVRKFYPNQLFMRAFDAHYELAKGDYEKAVAIIEKVRTETFRNGPIYIFLKSTFDEDSMMFWQDLQKMDELIAKEKVVDGRDEKAYRSFRRAQEILRIYQRYGPRFPRPDSLRELTLGSAKEAYDLTKGQWPEATTQYIELLGTIATTALSPAFSNEPKAVQKQIEEALKLLEKEGNNLPKETYLALKARLLMRLERFSDVLTLLDKTENNELKLIRVSAARAAGHVSPSLADELSEDTASERMLKAILVAELGHFNKAWELLRYSSEADESTYRSRILEALLGDQLLPQYWQSNVDKPVTLARAIGSKRDQFYDAKDLVWQKRREKPIADDMDVFAKFQKRKVWTLQWENWMTTADLEYLTGLAKAVSLDNGVYENAWSVKRESYFKRLSKLQWYRYADRAKLHLKSE